MTLPFPRVRFTMRAMMIAAAFIAIWAFIISQAIFYQGRHLNNHGGWGRS